MGSREDEGCEGGLGGLSRGSNFTVAPAGAGGQASVWWPRSCSQRGREAAKQQQRGRPKITKVAHEADVMAMGVEKEPSASADWICTRTRGPAVGPSTRIVSR